MAWDNWPIQATDQLDCSICGKTNNQYPPPSFKPILDGTLHNIMILGSFWDYPFNYFTMCVTNYFPWYSHPGNQTILAIIQKAVKVYWYKCMIVLGCCVHQPSTCRGCHKSAAHVPHIQSSVTYTNTPPRTCTSTRVRAHLISTYTGISLMSYHKLWLLTYLLCTYL